MFIISGSINNCIEEMSQVIARRDRDALLHAARDQVRWGADALDLCCCAHAETELEDLCWVVETLHDEIDTRLCIDSPEPEVQREALRRVRHNRPILNSTTLEQARIEIIAPIAREFDAELVVLLHDESGMPGTTQERLRQQGENAAMPDPAEDRVRLLPNVDQLVRTYGFQPEDICLDGLIFPQAVDTGYWLSFVETVRRVHAARPQYRISGGIDNGSHGLPVPEFLNISMLAMMLGAGADTAMIQLSPRVGAYLKALRNLCNEDEYCMDYITAYREGWFDKF